MKKLNLVTGPNSWSCVPCSFAMILGISYDEMISEIGHDGSEVQWPDLPDPMCRRSFHIQECIKVCWNQGVTVTPLQISPAATADGVRKYVLDHSSYVRESMRGQAGVLTGRGRNLLHAVAWDGAKAYDPKGLTYDLPNQLFTPHTFWAMI